MNNSLCEKIPQINIDISIKNEFYKSISYVKCQ